MNVLVIITNFAGAEPAFVGLAILIYMQVLARCKFPAINISGCKYRINFVKTNHNL